MDKNIDMFIHRVVTNIQEQYNPIEDILPSRKMLNREFLRFDQKKKSDKAIWIIGSSFEHKNYEYGTITYGSWIEGDRHTVRLTDYIETFFKKNELKQIDELYVAENLILTNKIRKEEEQAHENCKKKWQAIYQSCKDCNNTSETHPYLRNKSIDNNYSAKVSDDGKLLIFLQNGIETVGVQKIYQDFQNPNKYLKKFSYGVKKKGAFTIVGEAIEKCSKVYLAEGYATCCSIYMATNNTTVCAFDCDNLLPVAEKIRSINQSCIIIVCADDDIYTYKKDKQINVGVEHAEEVANSISGCVVKAPCFHNREKHEKIENGKIKGPTDFNDLLCLEGIKPLKEQLMLNELEEVKALILNDSKYKIINNCLSYINVKKEKNHCSYQQLCNFTAIIKREIFIDDGIDNKKYFEIVGWSETGKMLSKIEVISDSFANLNWVNFNWGANLIINAGSAIKDHLRVAIQTYSKDRIESTRKYVNFGWIKENGCYYFVHRTGAISASNENIGIEIAPITGLENFKLINPLEIQDKITPLKKSLSILKLTPPHIGYFLFASVYRAPLNEIIAVDFAIFIYGLTGVFKTEFASWPQSHFGSEFNSRTLPENWSSTDNTIEKKAYHCKDMVMVIDDFALSGNKIEMDKLFSKAERIFRGQGNKQGRGRLNSNKKFAPQYYSRSLLISTGEDSSKGHSILARLILIQIQKNSIDVENLTSLQKDAREGLLTAAMSLYLQWLSGKMDMLKKELPRLREKLRNEFSAKACECHKRTPDNLANLFLGLIVFFDFAIDMGVMTSTEKEYHIQLAKESFLKQILIQNEVQANENPVNKFLELVRTIISSRITAIIEITDQEYRNMPLPDKDLTHV